MKKIQYCSENVNIFQIYKVQSQMHLKIFAYNVIVDVNDAEKLNIKLKQ